MDYVALYLFIFGAWITSRLMNRIDEMEIELHHALKDKDDSDKAAILAIEVSKNCLQIIKDLKDYSATSDCSQKGELPHKQHSPQSPNHP